jgi:hypothetical protein
LYFWSFPSSFLFALTLSFSSLSRSLSLAVHSCQFPLFTFSFKVPYSSFLVQLELFLFLPFLVDCSLPFPCPFPFVSSRCALLSEFKPSVPLLFLAVRLVRISAFRMSLTLFRSPFLFLSLLKFNSSHSFVFWFTAVVLTNFPLSHRNNDKS